MLGWVCSLLHVEGLAHCLIHLTLSSDHALDEWTHDPGIERATLWDRNEGYMGGSSRR